MDLYYRRMAHVTDLAWPGPGWDRKWNSFIHFYKPHGTWGELRGCFENMKNITLPLHYINILPFYEGHQIDN